MPGKSDYTFKIATLIQMCRLQNDALQHPALKHAPVIVAETEKTRRLSMLLEGQVLFSYGGSKKSAARSTT